MIVYLFGKDVSVRKRAHEYVKTCGSVTHYFYEQTVSDNALTELAEGVSLFGDRTVVSIEGGLSKVSKETLILLKKGETVFFFDELDALKIDEEKIVYADHVFDGIVKKERDEFPFPLCNAIKRRDKKEAWLEFLKVKEKDEAELLHGAILWQVRAIHKDIIEGKKHAFTEREIERLHKELVEVFHDAHNGKLSLMNGLEMFVMRV